MPITYTPGTEPKPLPTVPEIPSDGSVHVIPLNRGLYTIINIVDVSLIDGWKFSAHNSHGNSWMVVAYRSCDADSTQESSYLHTLITGYSLTDHINGNTFDNRRANLRAASYSQNNYNSAIKSNNSSGFKGVTWHSQRKKWRVMIMLNSRNKHLGLFPADDDGVYTINGQDYDRGLIDAALAYDMAAREQHKSFATLNFPIAGERSALTGELRPMITT